jgi:hypothetical protein
VVEPRNKARERVSGSSRAVHEFYPESSCEMQFFKQSASGEQKGTVHFPRYENNVVTQTFLSTKEIGVHFAHS